ncbi:hypothetical protein EVAR_16688_1 [Eumeta japonica]|uniref:Uncharacterized protein n=1 Tax=Eumeta variegata TaxID=151549 RepID=A0A4C1V5V7_EUMVA|nr:hypothetical protein EVAR_16688_1 [Eumeta japonica]
MPKLCHTVRRIEVLVSPHVWRFHAHINTLHGHSFTVTSSDARTPSQPLPVDDESPAPRTEVVMRGRQSPIRHGCAGARFDCHKRAGPRPRPVEAIVTGN